MKKIAIYTLIAIILFISANQIISSCSSKKTKEEVKKIDISVLRANLIDSLNNIHFQQKDSILQAKTIEFNIRYKQLANENKKLSKKYNELLSEYDSTPEIQTPICDKIVKSANDVIENQKEIIQNRDSLINIKDSTIINCKLLITSKDSTIKELSINTTILSDRLKKKNNWWHRNEKWFYFGAGFLGTSLITR